MKISTEDKVGFVESAERQQHLHIKELLFIKGENEDCTERRSSVDSTPGIMETIIWVDFQFVSSLILIERLMSSGRDIQEY